MFVLIGATCFTSTLNADLGIMSSYFKDFNTIDESKCQSNVLQGEKWMYGYQIYEETCFGFGFSNGIKEGDGTKARAPVYTKGIICI